MVEFFTLDCLKFISTLTNSMDHRAQYVLGCLLMK
jgi:hypothetical protein